MADNTIALMALDRQAQESLAPMVTNLDLTPSRAPMLALLGRVQANMPWAPQNMVSTAEQIFNLGAFPRLRAYPPNTGKLPTWLSNPDNYNAWRKMVTTLYKPVDLALLKSNMALLAAEGEAAANDVEFWNTVSKYSGADAIERLWADLWAAIDAFKTQREATQTHLKVADDIIKAYGPKVPPALTSQTAAIKTQVASLDARARTALAPIPQATSTAGLGAITWVIAGVAGTIVVAVTASVWAIAHEFSAVQITAANNAQALLKWREQQDAADFAAGKITNEQLTARRQDNVRAAAEVADSQGAASLGRGFGAAGQGIALAAVGVVVLGLAAFAMTRHLRKKSP